MRITCLGHVVRFTDAVYDDHLMCQDGVLWVGRGELMTNVVRMAYCLADERIVECLLDKMMQSEREHRSLHWRD